jgi:hypothetical protein
MARFRFQRRKAWRFDPSLAHDSETVGERETALWSREGLVTFRVTMRGELALEHESWQAWSKR